MERCLCCESLYLHIRRVSSYSCFFATSQVFELLTAEYLFDPQGQGELFTKDDDHMAQIIELMGDFPLAVKMGGKYSRELFDHTGQRPTRISYPIPMLKLCPF